MANRGCIRTWEGAFMRYQLVTRPKPTVDLLKTKILYDWLSFSCELSFSEIGHILFGSKFDKMPFEIKPGSNRFYEFMAVYGNIRIHYTEDSARNTGCCVEMSGQGCREYEDINYRSLEDLINLIKYNGWHCSRLDVAFDDKHNHFPIFDMEQLSQLTLSRSFTSRWSQFKVDYSVTSQDGDPGISVQFGSHKYSETYLRIYDKRAERGVFDKLSHWVRCEFQLKNDMAMAFKTALGDIGHKFRQLLGHCLNYREENTTDTNKRRWDIASWWLKLLDGVESCKLVTRCFTSYNKGKLDDFVYKNCARAFMTAITCDRALDFINQMICSFYDRKSPVPSKYTSLIAQQTGYNPDDIFRHVQSFLRFSGLVLSPAGHGMDRLYAVSPAPAVPADPAPSL